MARLFFNPRGPIDNPSTPKALQLMRWFGIDRMDLQPLEQEGGRSITIRPGQICLITGPSGTGKTLLLRHFFAQTPTRSRLWLEEIVLESAPCLVDCIEGPLEETVRILTRMGLGDVRTLLKPPQRLSTGQQYRYRLLRALQSGRRRLFADEFGSCLDHAGAAVLAVQTAELIRHRRRILFAAAAREEIAEFLRPDIWICKQSLLSPPIIHRCPQDYSVPKSMPPVDR